MINEMKCISMIGSYVGMDIFKLNGTPFVFTVNSESHKIQWSRSCDDKYICVEFNEVFEEVQDEVRVELAFNLNIFNGSNG